MSEGPRIPCVVSLKRSGRELEVPGGQILLEALEAAGVPISSLCRGGSCGVCRALLISGTPVIESTKALRQQQRDEGWILTCSTRAVPGQRLVLDV